MMTKWIAAVAGGATLLAVAPEAGAQDARIEMREALVIGATGRSGRVAISADAMAAEIARRGVPSPGEGDTLGLADGSMLTWEKRAAGEDGWLRVAGGGWAAWTVEASDEQAGVWVLDASGHSMAYVGGEPRGGDPYQNGLMRTPVKLIAGTNTILLRSGRGRVRAALERPRAEVFFDLGDNTLPTVIRGENEDWWAGVVVVNATEGVLSGLRVTASTDDWQEGGHAESAAPVGDIPPLSARKIAVSLIGTERDGVDSMTHRLALWNGAEEVAAATIEVEVKDGHERHDRTFVSGIDGSVQYYTVVPRRMGGAGRANGDAAEPPREPGMIVTLHGAGVEGRGQAACYLPKDFAVVVAPTNRRPFGFDWEDWGRWDALEVMALAGARFAVDATRVWLTGHSMGGHGAWNIGASMAGRFAAIGPSAGWISFWSYTGAGEDEGGVSAMFRRAAGASDTLAVVKNLDSAGVFILHGDADDNVPVAQARQMKAELEPWHPDMMYWEQPGAGHWWGNECVDFGPMIEFFRERRLPRDEEVDRVTFATMSPGVNSGSAWASIEAQRRSMERSSVNLGFDAAASSLEGTTENVLRLGIDSGALVAAAGDAGIGAHGDGGEGGDGRAPELVVTLDETTLRVPIGLGQGRIFFERVGENGPWEVAGDVDAGRKSPARSGPFKDAFRNRMILVYPTGGTEEENAGALARARFDAETFGYRGNGSVDVVSDKAMIAGTYGASPGPGGSKGDQRETVAERDRSVILYGNADINGAWDVVLDRNAAARVTAGAARVGDRSVEGDDVACLFVLPRKGSDRASVGVVGWTGEAGRRVTERVPYFVSGVGVPDWCVMRADVLEEGMAAVTGAGFFGDDWSYDADDARWKEQ